MLLMSAKQLRKPEPLQELMNLLNQSEGELDGPLNCTAIIIIYLLLCKLINACCFNNAVCVHFPLNYVAIREWFCVISYDFETIFDVLVVFCTQCCHRI